MSCEELKIRSELEMDVERDLEEEIKDGIYHLALRLHRLYQHQKERNDQENDQRTKKKKDNKSILEVNINIRMEGGTKIEIKEMVKREADHQENGRRPRTSSSNRSMQEIVASKRKKFDWVSTLRSGTTTDDHIIPHYKPKYLIKNDVGTKENVRVEQGENVGRRKGNVSVRRSEEREIGWKD